MNTLQPRPVLKAPRTWTFPTFKTETLKSGLSLHKAHVRGKEVITGSLLLPLSTLHDPVGKEGLVSLCAMLLDEGTKTRTSEEFSDALELLGASWDARVSPTGTVITVSAPRATFPDALALLAEALSEPLIPEREFERVKRQVIDGTRSALANPKRRASVHQRQAIWDKQSRHALPDGGTPETLSSITRQDVLDMVSTITPWGADLVCVGDLNNLDLVNIVRTTFAAWKGGRIIREAQTPDLASKNARLVVVDRPGSVQTQLALGMVAPGRTSPHWASLQVGTHILGGGLSSRIDSVLREEKGYTYGIHASLAPLPEGATWSVAGAVDTGNTAAAVEDLYRILQQATQGVTLAEVEAASSYLVGVSPLRWETPQALASQAVYLLGAGLAPQWINAYLSGMQEATPTSVDAALHEVLDIGLHLVAVGDASVIAPSLEQITGLTPEIISE